MDKSKVQRFYGPPCTSLFTMKGSKQIQNKREKLN